MALMTHELKASYAFIERNFFLSRRYWGWEIAFLVYHIAGALSIAFIGVALGDRQLLLSLMIGAIFWNYLAAVFSIIAEQVGRAANGRHHRVLEGSLPALDRDRLGDPAEDHRQVVPEDRPDHQGQKQA